MRFERSRLRWPEIVAGVAAVVLLLSMFLLPWYGHKGDLAPLAARLGVSTSGDAWHSLSTTRWLLLLTIMAALALVYLQRHAALRPRCRRRSACSSWLARWAQRAGPDLSRADQRAGAKRRCQP